MPQEQNQSPADERVSISQYFREMGSQLRVALLGIQLRPMMYVLRVFFRAFLARARRIMRVVSERTIVSLIFRHILFRISRRSTVSAARF
jgi:hypothetical protein